MRDLGRVFLLLMGLGAGCRSDEATPAPSADAVRWDDPMEAAALDWPMPGVTPEGGDPQAFAPSSGGATVEIWRRLASYASTFLRSWRAALESTDEPAAVDVVDAFNELAYAVTGPGGFWRKTVPQQWLGCGLDATTPPGCDKMAQAESDLARWDVIQRQIGDLAPEEAGRFLNRNKKRILTYLDTYVPPSPSASGMKETGFYRSYLAAVLGP